jgi:hypothetical protein
MDKLNVWENYTTAILNKILSTYLINTELAKKKPSLCLPLTFVLSHVLSSFAQDGLPLQLPLCPPSISTWCSSMSPLSIASFIDHSDESANPRQLTADLDVTASCAPSFASGKLRASFSGWSRWKRCHSHEAEQLRASPGSDHQRRPFNATICSSDSLCQVGNELVLKG